MMNKAIDRYLVVGNPIGHSRSPEIHGAFAAQFGDEIQYDKAEVALDGFEAFVDAFARGGGCGMNVTVPFKNAAFEYVTQCDARASAARAVNTIKFEADGKSLGFNTDGAGLLNDLRRHGVEIAGTTVLMLGAGGAAQGVLEPLLEAGPERLVIANRTLSRAAELASRHAQDHPYTSISAVGFDQIAPGADLVINATSIGLSADESPLSAAAVNNTFCYDMSYGAAAKFCRWALEHGAKTSVDGLGMLVEQAAESYFLWRGKRPQTQPVLDMLRKSLESS